MGGSRRRGRTRIMCCRSRSATGMMALRICCAGAEMRNTYSRVAIVFTAGVTLCAGGAAKKSWSFRPARFGSLVVGLDSTSDALKAFGKPKHVGQPEGAPSLVFYSYERLAFVPCPHLRVMLKFDKGTQRLVNVEVHCTRDLTLQELKDSFGADWRLTRWDNDRCLADGEGDLGPIFQVDTGGVAEFWENRPLGLAYNPDSRIFEYLSVPIGPSRSRCASRVVK